MAIGSARKVPTFQNESCITIELPLAVALPIHRTLGPSMSDVAISTTQEFRVPLKCFRHTERNISGDVNYNNNQRQF